MTPTKPSHDGVFEAADHDRFHNDEVAHEHSDINIRTVLMAAFALALVTGIVMTVIWGVFTVLEHQAAANDPQLSPLAVPADQVPPKPSILDNQHEPQKLRDFRTTEAKTLEGYGWVDEKAGVAHVPIEEAKKLILQRGIPVRQGAPADPLLGTHAPAYGEANGGRALTRPPVRR